MGGHRGLEGRLRASRLRLLAVGDVRPHLHRPLRGTPKAITVRREGRRWWLTVRCVDVPARPLPATGRTVGIDLEVCAQLATSDGTLVMDGRYGRRGADRLAAAQRSLAAKVRGSNRRRRAVERVAGAHRKIREQRTDLAHQLSRQLVDGYDLIVHEDLRIANMVRRPKPKRGEGCPMNPTGRAPSRA